jgi:3-oxoacyl-[acyl-carrier-protein] synthase III
MAVFSVPNIKIKGISAAVPKQVEDNKDFNLLAETERDMFIKTVGIRYRRVASAGVTASDLCQVAAQKLLSDLNWNPAEVQLLVFVTQTPDYIIPNTASLLQQKLGLSKSCIAFDVNLGCSGYVYGLSIIGGLLQNMPGVKGLLLVGDISTATISMRDKSTAPLFSDAGSATAVEYSFDSQIHFNLQTDGNEFDDIIIPEGGYRNRLSEKTLAYTEYEKGISRNQLHMKLDGIKIFNFGLREVASNIETLLLEKEIPKDSIDYFVFHQANLLMLESIRKKLKAPVEKVPYSLYDYGNTSSATIPVTLVTKLREQLEAGKTKLLLSGFGVGLSWGSAYIETDNIVCPKIIETA